MIEVPIYDQTGKKIESLQVDEAKFGGEVKRNLLKQAIVAYHANKRQGTVRTLARGEVAGSTRKMFKQKGTGNARTGGIRNPIKKGGGHAKQKRPKDWRQGLPKKVRRAARNSAILLKLQSADIRVLNEIKFPEPKTRHVAAMYKALGIDRSCLFAINGRDESIERSARNLDRTTLTTVDQLNAWDIMKNRTLLMTRAGLESLLRKELNVRPAATNRGESDRAMDNINVIIKPLVTEKSTHLQETRNAYAFQVSRSANKVQIRRAVEQLYNVKVVAVRTMNRKGKPRRSRFKLATASNWKRAIVVLDENSRMELF